MIFIVFFYIICDFVGVSSFQNGNCIGKNTQLVHSTTFLNAGFGNKIATSKGPTIPNDNDKCICGSGKNYGACCGRFHKKDGTIPNPVEMVRSRFSAFAYKNLDYIMETTHPTHPEYVFEEQLSKKKIWLKSLSEFANSFEFIDLKFQEEALEAKPDVTKDIAYVNFVARVKKNLENQVIEEIRERSLFKKADDGRWLYADCEIIKDVKRVNPRAVTGSKRMITTVRRGGGNY
jgi:SEC-C motif-containing protein